MKTTPIEIRQWCAYRKIDKMIFNLASQTRKISFRPDKWKFNGKYTGVFINTVSASINVGSCKQQGLLDGEMGNGK